MKTFPIAGTASSIGFFEDDILESVRQHLALAVQSHPDRLFLEVQESFPPDYYHDTRNWECLFLRMSLDGKVVNPELFKTYITQTRTIPMEQPTTALTHEEWMTKPSFLEPIYMPDSAFLEWRILGVPGRKSLILPLPPRDVQVPSQQIPLPEVQVLFDTYHHEVIQFRITSLPEQATQTMQRVYTPFLRSETPQRLSESIVRSLKTSVETLDKLLALNAPEPSHVTVLRAKWYIPLIDTQFGAPRTRFEQMFYGLTVSEATPYIGYFTSKQEAIRHKFYVTEPRTKKPSVDLTHWHSWSNATQPQRKLPTLMLFKGTDRKSFDRIVMTPKDIVVTAFRTRESSSDLETIKTDLAVWFSSLDSIMAFIKTSDLVEPRWELQDLSVLSKYSTDITEFDMRRFPCLQSVFATRGSDFQLLRANHGADVLSSFEVRAYQVLNQSDTPGPDVLVEELGISQDEAKAIIKKFSDLGEDIDLERVLRHYPVLKFSNNEILMTGIVNGPRTIKYADILRYVLTTTDDIDSVCPRRSEAVEAVAVAPQAIEETDFQIDDDLAGLLGLENEEEAPPSGSNAAAAPAAAPVKKLKVKTTKKSTYNYFNKKLQEFDPATFDSTIYPLKCDKSKQVIVLTPEDETRIPAQYNPRGYGSVMELDDPKGIATCPQYWCIRDMIPLRADQLVDNTCPVCGGKVRTENDEDIYEYSVIKRDQTHLFPGFIGKIVSSKNGRRIPCCYKEERAPVEAIARNDESYILSSPHLPELRIGYLDADMAASLKIVTTYSATVKKGDRLEAGKGDFFRIGLGRPSKTLPVLLGDKTVIPEPKNAQDKLMLCSFFRTWKDPGEGATEIERLVAGVQRAYESGELPMLDEMEYVTSILKCRVVQIHTSTRSMSCGFWSDSLDVKSRTIVMVDNELLGHVTRNRGTKFAYQTDIQRAPFVSATVSTVLALHARACSSNIPTFDKAITELRSKGKTVYEIIHDPFGRIQALFVPKEVILPIQPLIRDSKLLPEDIRMTRTRAGYHDIRDNELPTRSVLKAFLDTSVDAGFRWVSDLYDMNGRATEALLASRFRAPFQPVDGGDPASVSEVLSTVRDGHREKELVDGEPNPEDDMIVKNISYDAEVFDFMLYTLSKDVQNADYATLRAAIESGEGLIPELRKWADAETAWVAGPPRTFVSKVRTPCGQLTSKETCEKSTLCGWHGPKACKLTVSETKIDRDSMIRRLAKTLRGNGKQRALVLDERLSPFFSSVLYLEMPHEWITTVV